MFYQIHTYTELQQQIHDDLRIQHPEWVKANGECPTCDSYESRLTELIGASMRTEANGPAANTDNLKINSHTDCARNVLPTASTPKAAAARIIVGHHDNDALDPGPP